MNYFLLGERRLFRQCFHLNPRWPLLRDVPDEASLLCPQRVAHVTQEDAGGEALAEDGWGGEKIIVRGEILLKILDRTVLVRRAIGFYWRDLEQKYRWRLLSTYSWCIQHRTKYSIKYMDRILAYFQGEKSMWVPDLWFRRREKPQLNFEKWFWMYFILHAFYPSLYFFL